MSYLKTIIARKKNEIKHLIHDPYLNQILERDRPASRRFSTALHKGPTLNIIGEIKRRSPSVGAIREEASPLHLAFEYCQGGAAAVSVLTDLEGFKGTLEDLKNISEGLSLRYPTVPTMRKDFIIHPIQLAEAILAGASAVLLIASSLGKQLSTLLKETERLGLEALTEVQDRASLDIALEAGAPIIGVNHRNLDTFQIDMNMSATLRPYLPSSVVKVAESGIHTPEQARRLYDLGYDTILVGEALMRSPDPSAFIASLKGGHHDR